jgi:hypothetical protein
MGKQSYEVLDALRASISLAIRADAERPLTRELFNGAPFAEQTIGMLRSMLRRKGIHTLEQLAVVSTAYLGQPGDRGNATFTAPLDNPNTQVGQALRWLRERYDLTEAQAVL